MHSDAAALATRTVATTGQRKRSREWHRGASYCSSTSGVSSAAGSQAQMRQAPSGVSPLPLEKLPRPARSPRGSGLPKSKAAATVLRGGGGAGSSSKASTAIVVV